MNLRAAVVLSLALLGATAARGADLSAWTKTASVEIGPPPAKGLVEVELTPAALAVAQKSLDDLRLTDAGGQLVPCIARMDRGTGEKSVEYAPARLFNAVSIPGTQSSVTVDFGNRDMRTSIVISTPGANFRRQVRVEASTDGAAWEVLRQSDWLFRINYERGFYDKSSVDLPANDFQFLRITVFNAPDDPAQIPIEKVTAWRSQFKPPQPATVTPASVRVSQNSELKATEIEVDLGWENVPVYELSPTFADAHFVRRVEVLARNVRTRTVVEPVENSQPRTRVVDEPWAIAATGSLFRLPGGQGQAPTENTTVGGAWQQDRYFLLRIYNGDDAPLTFTGLTVRRFRAFLSFRAASAGPCKLFLGNANAPALHFDLEDFADRLRAEGVTTATLGPIEPNPLFAQPSAVIPWSEQHAAVLWAALAAALLVLSGLVVWQVRAARQAGTKAA